MQSPTDGQPDFQHYRPVEGAQAGLQTHPMVPPIPPPTAFQLYAEARFLSQPHTHSSKHASTPAALMDLARETWDTESEGVKQFYLLQESKAKENYETQVAAAQNYEMQQQEARGGVPEGRAISFDREREKAEAERMEVDDAERVGETGRGSAGGAGGFTSING